MTKGTEGGADQETVDVARRVAGTGRLDERCARIVAVYAPWWWDPDRP